MHLNVDLKILNKLIFVFFILLHLFFLNINAVEWGDSYRILRASEFIRRGEYPIDEKRPPLYSAVLAAHPSNVDQVFWGKVVMFVVSLISFVLFQKLVELYIKDEKYQTLALSLFAVNPVFFYWSLRIYADVFFTLFVMLTFYLFKKYEKSLSFGVSILIGILAGLAVITRFEGYFLGASLGLAFLLKKNFRNLAGYAVGGLLFVIPYLLWRNPLTSTYLEEPSNRAYDLTMLLTYIVSFLYLIGFTSAFYFIFRDWKGVKDWVGDNIGITAFIVLELFLILVWPAAIPRLFVPVIPFLIILIAQSTGKYFDDRQKTGVTPLLGLTTLLVVYVVAQYFLKLQFLILSKPVFAAIILSQLVSLFFIFRKNFGFFAVTVFLSALIWSVSTVWLHKNNLIAIKTAAEYASENLTGVVGYNDISSVSDWYLNQKNPSGRVSGVYYHYAKKKDLDPASLSAAGLDYLILTNEHNTDTALDLESRPYLEPVKDFYFDVGGKRFFARIVKVKPENR